MSGQTNSYSLFLQNTGMGLLLAAKASVPGMPGEGPISAQCHCTDSDKKKFHQKLVWKSKGAILSQNVRLDPLKKGDCCSWAVLSHIAYVCFNFKLSVSPRFVTQTYGTGITFYRVFIESAVAAQAAQRCHNVNNIYY